MAKIRICIKFCIRIHQLTLNKYFDCFTVILIVYTNLGLKWALVAYGACECVSWAFGQYVEEILINMVTRDSKIILVVLTLPKDTPNNMHIGL